MKIFIVLLVVLVPGTLSIAESKDTAATANTNQSSTVIVNNSIWKDTDGNTVWASLGGHISKFDDTYYWVGTDPRKEDSSNRLYSSKTLGSNTWKFENYIEKRKGGLGKRNCTMIYCPKTKKYVIICKGIGFYQSKGSDVKGPYEYVKKISLDKLKKYKKFASGGMSAYQEGDDAYVIISMKNHTMRAPRDIFCLILKLSPDFLNFEQEILWMPTKPQREAFWLFKKDKKYYMTYDGPGGWMGSDCYYRTADKLEGPWSEEKKIGMIPEPKYKEDRSHASQHRYIMNINGQWIYGGDRYPYQEPESHPAENGQHIICPVIWDGERPYVIWEDKWDISKYDKNAKLAKAKSNVSETPRDLPRKNKKRKKKTSLIILARVCHNQPTIKILPKYQQIC